MSLRAAFLVSSLSLGLIAALACGGGPAAEPPDLEPPPPSETLAKPDPPAPPVQPAEPAAEPDEEEPEAPWLSLVSTRSPPLDPSADEHPLCQPDSFVPGERRVIPDPSQRLFDKLEGEDPEDRWRGVNVSDWTEGLNLPAGMTIKRWSFECDPNPSFADEVIEISQDGVRKALFTHIHALASSPDGTRIFFVNLVRSGGSWVRKVRILDLTTFEAQTLPLRGCNAYGGIEWLDGHFVTSTGYSEWVTHGELCLWTESGELLQHLRYKHGIMGMGAPRLSQSDAIYVFTESVEPCGGAVIDLERGIARFQAREDGEGMEGFQDCLVAPGPMDAAAFERFGAPMPL